MSNSFRPPTGRRRKPALMRIEFAKAMAQLLQDLANELACLAQRMIRRNPLFRPNVREKAALILEPSAHFTLPQNHCGKSESPPLRSGELFQQTARGVLRQHGRASGHI